jgi:RNA ligase (TIGR02306 family)
LRGVSSFGFVIPTELQEIGRDLNGIYEAVRYEPAPKLYQGDQLPEHPKFHRYTEIENVQRFPDTIPEGTPVAISEKLHGTAARLAVIDGEFIVGSHRCQRVAGDNIYWRALEPCLTFLNDMKEDGHDVIVFGEIYGRGIQDLTYGETTPVFRCFDISVNGLYLSHYLTMMLCKSYSIPTVPILWVGAYSHEKLVSLTDGKSSLADHVREGVVVKALEETVPRQILKSVSVDYLARD